jgi:hypothetical protein
MFAKLRAQMLVRSSGRAASISHVMHDPNTPSSPRTGPAPAIAAARWGQWPLAGP